MSLPSGGGKCNFAGWFTVLSWTFTKYLLEQEAVVTYPYYANLWHV